MNAYSIPEQPVCWPILQFPSSNCDHYKIETACTFLLTDRTNLHNQMYPVFFAAVRRVALFTFFLSIVTNAFTGAQLF